jgi:hypothetical protein
MGWILWDSNPGRGKRFFSSPKHPTSYSVDTGGLFPKRIKWPGREVDHSLPSVLMLRMS